MTTSEPDEFDRIVEGIDLDGFDLDGVEEQDFQALSERPAFRLPENFGMADASESALDRPEFEELTYREAPNVLSSGNPWRTVGWLSLVAAPVLLIVLSIVDVWVPPVLVGAVVLGCVGLLAYLALTNPQNPADDRPFDDGSEV